MGHQLFGSAIRYKFALVDDGLGKLHWSQSSIPNSKQLTFGSKHTSSWHHSYSSLPSVIGVDFNEKPWRWISRLHSTNKTSHTSILISSRNDAVSIPRLHLNHIENRVISWQGSPFHYFNFQLQLFWKSSRVQWLSMWAVASKSFQIRGTEENEYDLRWLNAGLELYYQQINEKEIGELRMEKSITNCCSITFMLGMVPKGCVRNHAWGGVCENREVPGVTSAVQMCTARRRETQQAGEISAVSMSCTWVHGTHKVCNLWSAVKRTSFVM